MVINTGLIFSICAGILIGMKLYVWTSIERPKQKEAKKKAEQKEFYDYIRKELVMSQQKQYELNLLRQKRDALIQLEKIKQINKELGYSSPIESTKKTEQQWKEKAKTICRDLWYGTCPKNGVDKEMTNDGFEDLLNDPETIFLENYDLNSLSRTICVKSKGKTYQFIVNDENMFNYR